MDGPPNVSHMDVDSEEEVVTPAPLSQLRIRALTPNQERKLMNYLDERFLQLTRNYKKRNETSSTLRTLSAYLKEARRLLALILQIPPIDPSTPLRTAYLLHLTGDVLGSIPGYNLTNIRNTEGHPPHNTGGIGRIEPSVETVQTTLRDLLDFLDDLDQAWLAVLQGQIWDPSLAEGVDLNAALDHRISASTNGSQPVVSSIKTTPPSQTEVTRLRSLLVAGESTLEDWLGVERLAQSNTGADDDLAGMLERMGLLDEFQELFGRSLDFLGGFGGASMQPEPLGDEVVMT